MGLELAGYKVRHAFFIIILLINDSNIIFLISQISFKWVTRSHQISKPAKSWPTAFYAKWRKFCRQDFKCNFLNLDSITQHWCRKWLDAKCDKPLPETMLTKLVDVYMRHWNNLLSQLVNDQSLIFGPARSQRVKLNFYESDICEIKTVKMSLIWSNSYSQHEMFAVTNITT